MKKNRTKYAHERCKILYKDYLSVMMTKQL